MSRKTRAELEEEAAEDYAWSIKNNINRDWKSYNAILIEQFSLTALQRIKARAWKMLQEPDRW